MNCLDLIFEQTPLREKLNFVRIITAPIIMTLFFMHGADFTVGNLEGSGTPVLIHADERCT